MPEQDKLQEVYNLVGEKYSLPDYETFKSNMAQEPTRRKFYDVMAGEYDMPDYDTFSDNIGFSNKVQKKSPVGTEGGSTQKKKSPELPLAPTQEKSILTESSPKEKTPAASTGSGLKKQEYLDIYVEGTKKIAAKNPGWTDLQWDAYYKSLSSQKGFSKTDIDYISAGQKAAQSKLPVAEQEGLNKFIKRQDDLKQGKTTPDAYAETSVKESDDAYRAYKERVKQESIQSYIPRQQEINRDPVAGYMGYLQEHNPSRYESIMERKNSGRWDKGANAFVKDALSNSALGVPIVDAAISGGYELVSEIMGADNTEDSANLYVEALTWKGQTESAVLSDLGKTPQMQTYGQLAADVNNSPIAMATQEFGKQTKAIQGSQEMQMLDALSKKAQANGGRLEKADMDVYQQLQQSPVIQQFTQAQAAYQQLLETPEGQKFQQQTQALEQLSQTPEVKQYMEFEQNSQGTKQKMDEFSSKFPDDYFHLAYEKSKKYATDGFYQRLNPIVKGMLDVSTTALRVPITLAGEVAAGLIKSTAAIERATLSTPDAAIFHDDLANAITSMTNGINGNLFPQPSNLELPIYDHFIPYNDARIYTNSRGEVIDIRDQDGYAMNEDTAARISAAYENDPEKPKAVRDWNVQSILPRITQTAVDLAVLSQVPLAGAGLGMGHKASMVAYGYLTNYSSAHEEIKASDPFISEDAANLYAATKGLMMGGLLTLTPESFFAKKNGEFAWAEIKGNYTQILAGGVPAKIAMTKALSMSMAKEGTAMAGIGVAMDLADRAIKLASNSLTDRPAQETEYKFNQFAESAVSMFVVGSVMHGFKRGFTGVRGDALYTGLKNYEQTAQSLEQLANAGKISQTDFARAANLLTQLKPVYDNLADFGKYNNAYKSRLIGLYAEKLRIEERLESMTPKGSAAKETTTPERESLTRDLKAVDSKIESLSIVNNPDFIVYTPKESVSLNLPAEVTEIFKKQQDGGVLTSEEKNTLSAYKFYQAEDGSFRPADASIEVKDQWLFDPATAKFMAVKEQVVGAEEVGGKPKFTGVRVRVPEFFQDGTQLTRTELQQKLKDPVFLADLKSGRIQVDVFNDLEMTSLIEKYQPRKPRPRKEITQGGAKKDPTKIKGVLARKSAVSAPEAVPAPETKSPGTTPAGPKKAGALPEGPGAPLQVEGISVQGAKNIPVQPVGGGPAGFIEREADGSWYFTDENGRSAAVVLKDNSNPTEKLADIGFEAVPASSEVTPVVPIQLPEKFKIPVTLKEDGGTFAIEGLGDVTWTRFNYSNYGELQTADVVLPDGKRMKIKDREIVYDMAVELSNRNINRGVVTRQQVEGNIQEAVQPVKDSFDVGMKAIDTIFDNADDAVSTAFELLGQGASLPYEIYNSAIRWVDQVIDRIEGIETRHTDEKGNILQFLEDFSDQILTASVEPPVASEPDAITTGTESSPADQSSVSPAGKQPVLQHPEASQRTRAIIQRLTGDRSKVDAVISAVRDAYDAGTSPTEAITGMGYNKEIYKPYLKQVIEALKPTEVEEAPAVESELPVELRGEIKVGNTGFGGQREHTQGKVNLEDLKVLDNGIETAKKTLAEDKNFKPTKEPIVVGVDVATGEKQLLDGYHRYVSQGGKGEVDAKFIPMKGGDIIGFEEVRDTETVKKAEPAVEPVGLDFNPEAYRDKIAPENLTRFQELVNSFNEGVTIMQGFAKRSPDESVARSIVNTIAKIRTLAEAAPAESILKKNENLTPEQEIERERKDALSTPVSGRAPTIEDGEFRIGRGRDLYRMSPIGKFKGKLERKNFSGAWTDEVPSTDKLLKRAEKEGFIRSKTSVNAIYDAKLAAIKSAPVSAVPKTTPVSEVEGEARLVIEELNENSATEEMSEVLEAALPELIHNSGLPEEFNVAAEVVAAAKLQSVADAKSLHEAMMYGLLKGSTSDNNLLKQKLQTLNQHFDSESLPALFDKPVLDSRKEFYKLVLKDLPKYEQKIVKDALDSGGYGLENQAEDGFGREAVGNPRPSEGVGRYSGFSIVSAQAKTKAFIEGLPDDVKSKYTFNPNQSITSNSTGYRAGTVQYASVITGMNQKGFFPKGASGEKLARTFAPFTHVKVAYSPKAERHYLQIENTFWNPFKATTSPVAREVVSDNAVAGTSTQLQVFRQGQFRFDENTGVQYAKGKTGDVIPFTSARAIIESSTDLQKDFDKIISAKIGRELSYPEYATKTNIPKVIPGNYTTGSVKITSAADVAYLARQFEDSNVENSVLVITDKLGQSYFLHVATGTVSAVDMPYQTILDSMQSFDAASFYLLHNHPSGDTEPSPEDLQVLRGFTAMAKRHGYAFNGYVIVDYTEGKYVVLDHDLNTGESFLDPEQKRPTTAENEVEYPVYMPGRDITFGFEAQPVILGGKTPSERNTDVNDFISSLYTKDRGGPVPKAGMLALNTNGRVVGNMILDGVNDVQKMQRMVAATTASHVITYGTGSVPVVPVGRHLMPGVEVLDHVTYQSGIASNANVMPGAGGNMSAPQIPRSSELSLPFNSKSSKLEKAVQQSMVDGFLKFDEIMLNLYTNVYVGDVKKLRSMMQDIKDAYDTLSLEGDESWMDQVSSIDEVAHFDLDNFLMAIQSPHNTEPQSLRQQYNEFCSWFEYTFPGSKFYYTIEIDPEFGNAVFKVGEDYVKKPDGTTLTYGDWVNNRRIQNEWTTQRAEIFNRPPLVVLDEDLLPEPPERVKEGQYEIDEHQRLGVNLPLHVFLDLGQKGAINADGMGVGKTRQLEVLADQLRNHFKLPVLIITKNDLSLEQFKREAAAISLRDIEFKRESTNSSKPLIIMGTYEDMRNSKIGQLDEYGAVLFDESHMLKNTGTARSVVADALLRKAKHNLFATGTPMDKPVQMVYFLSHMYDEPLDVTLNKLGLAFRNGRLYSSNGVKGIKEAILALRNQLIDNGAYLRREYPFYGTMDKVTVPLPDYAIESMEEIKAKTSRRTAIGEGNRYQEHLKIPYILNETTKALAEGKRVVVFCMGVNETEIKSLGKLVVPQFAEGFSKELDKRGIPHAKIYGPNIKEKMEESRRFQRGDVKVVIATITSGGTGIDLDDQVGDGPREVLFATLPWSGTDFDQALYRVSRRNTKTPSRIRFVLGGESWVDEHKEKLVDQKMEIVRGIQAGKDPDEIAMEYWQENPDGEIVDIIEDETDENGNIIEPVGGPGDVVMSIEPKPIEMKGDEFFEKFNAGDTDALREAGELPKLQEDFATQPIATEADVTPPQAEVPAPETVEPEAVVPEIPAQEPENVPEVPGVEAELPAVEAAEPPAVEAAETTSEAAGQGSPKESKAIPIVRTKKKSTRIRINEILFGKKAPETLAARVLRELKELGVPTGGEMPMYKKRLLGFYEHLPADIKLKYASEIFVAAHEAMHWIDFSVMNGLTYKIIKDADMRLIGDLTQIYKDFYPVTSSSDPMETKVAEGLTMFMQMSLFDPTFPDSHKYVRDQVFTPGAKYYHPKMSELHDRFAAIRDEIMLTPDYAIAMERVFSQPEQTGLLNAPGWNAFTKALTLTYSESIPLQLFDEASGVGPYSKGDRRADGTEPAPFTNLESAQAEYLMYRNAYRVASNLIKSDADPVSRAFGEKAMFYDVDGKWKPSKHRVSDIEKAVTEAGKKHPELLKGLKGDANDLYASYLINRRMYMEYVKRKDIMSEMDGLIRSGMHDYRILDAEIDPDIHATLKSAFNKNYLLPFIKLAREWMATNNRIGNELGSRMDMNKFFSASLLAWKKPSLYGQIAEAKYDPNKGLLSETVSTAGYNTLKGPFAEATKIYDYMNQNMLRSAVAFGLISSKAAVGYIKEHAKYPGYASFQKAASTMLFDNDDFKSKMKSAGATLSYNMRWQGSSSQIVHPMLSLIAATLETYRKGTKNLINVRLANQARNSPELARGFQKLRTTYVPSGTDPQGNPILKPQPKGDTRNVHVEAFKINGSPVFYAVTDEGLHTFFNSMQNYTGDYNSGILKTAANAVADVFVIGTTALYPVWFILNFTVDQILMGINSHNGTIPFLSTGKHVGGEMLRALNTFITRQARAVKLFQKLFPGQVPNAAQINYMQEYVSLSGTQATTFGSLHEMDFREAIQKLTGQTPSGVIPVVKHGIQLTRDVVVDYGGFPTNFTEVITRATEYIIARKKGASQEQAMLQANNIAPFFKRPGKKGIRDYTRMVSYLHSQLVIFGRLLEEVKDRPARLSLIAMGTASLGALLIGQLWDEFTEDEKNYYRQLDGRSLSQYFRIPMRLVNGVDNGQFLALRIPEHSGAPYAMGLQIAMAMADSSEYDAKGIAASLTSVIPSIINPVEYVAGDNTIPKSLFRNILANSPNIIRTPAEMFGGRGISMQGSKPIVPKSLEYFPAEYQYNIGLKGASTASNSISNALGKEISPAEVDYLGYKTMGRSWYFWTGLYDNKNPKDAVFIDREDREMFGKWYTDFYQKAAKYNAEWNVIDNYRKPIPKEDHPSYGPFLQEMQKIAKAQTVYSEMQGILKEAANVREHAMIYGKPINEETYNALNAAVRSLYEEKPMAISIEKIDQAYEALSAEASRVGYSNIQYFSKPSPSTRIDPVATAKYYSKLYNR